MHFVSWNHLVLEIAEGRRRGGCFWNGRSVHCRAGCSQAAPGSGFELLAAEAVTSLQGGFLDSLAEDPTAQKRTKIPLQISDFCYSPGNVALEGAVCSAGEPSTSSGLRGSLTQFPGWGCRSALSVTLCSLAPSSCLSQSSWALPGTIYWPRWAFMALHVNHVCHRVWCNCRNPQ